MKTFFENALAGNTGRPLSDVCKAGYWLFCDLVGKINTASDSVGKDGKFQVFICVGIRYVLSNASNLIGHGLVVICMKSFRVKCDKIHPLSPQTKKTTKNN